MTTAIAPAIVTSARCSYEIWFKFQTDANEPYATLDKLAVFTGYRLPMLGEKISLYTGEVYDFTVTQIEHSCVDFCITVFSELMLGAYGTDVDAFVKDVCSYAERNPDSMSTITFI